MTSGWIAFSVLWGLFSLGAVFQIGREVWEGYKHDYSSEHYADYLWIKVPAVILFAPVVALFIFWKMQ